MKKLFLIVGGMYALFSLSVWHLTDGFSLNKIQSDLSYSPKWEVANPPLREIKPLFDQNFYYLGAGSQCYVFESEDKQFVLKFFKHSRYRLPAIYHYTARPTFVSEIQNRKREVKSQKLKALFQSCKIAYEELRQETGLLYLHLNKTAHLHQKVILHDKLKRPYPISLDDYEFVLQKRGEQIFPYLTRLIESDKKQEAEEALSDLVALLCKRMNKGIADHDAVIHKNSGFLGAKALFLDVGEFEKTRCANTRQELVDVTRELYDWLLQKDPDLAGYLDTLTVSAKNGYKFPS